MAPLSLYPPGPLSKDQIFIYPFLLLKLNDKEITRCHAVSLDYDYWKYTVNNTDTKDLPPDVERVTVVVEHPG